MEVTARAWVATIAAIIVLLGVDLAIGALRPHAVGSAEATAWSVFYVAVALAFGVIVGLVAGWDIGGQHSASTGLAMVLAFIGGKLILHWGHTLSDAVPTVRAHAGSLRAHPTRRKAEPPADRRSGAGQ